MKKRDIDLSDIKDFDLDKTSSFTDLMTKKERKKRNDVYDSNNDIEEMVVEKKRSNKDLTKELKKAKEEFNNNITEEKEDNLGKTQILELTRQMKFNLQEKQEENNSKKKKVFSPLNVIGEVNLLCIGYYIYLLLFTSYQDNQINYMIIGSIIVLLVLLFGLSIVTNKKLSKFFNILNILTIISFIAFNIYTLIY